MGNGKEEILLPSVTQDGTGMIFEVPDYRESGKGFVACESKCKSERHGKKVTESMKYSQKWSSKVKMEKKSRETKIKAHKSKSTDASTQTDLSADADDELSLADLSSARPISAGLPSTDGRRFQPGASSRYSDRARRRTGKKIRKSRTRKIKDRKTSNKDRKRKEKLEKRSRSQSDSSGKEKNEKSEKTKKPSRHEESSSSGFVAYLTGKDLLLAGKILIFGILSFFVAMGCLCIYQRLC